MEIEQYLHEHIPISRHMGVTVSHYNDEHVELSMSLKPNLNHRSTAFGGSISTLGILAGWTLLHMQFCNTAAVPRLVVQRSETRFLKPVMADFTALCAMPSASSWAHFLKTLSKHSRARISLVSELRVGQDPVAYHDGDFVAELAK